MHVDSPFPPLSKELIDRLAELFPDRAPEVGTPDAEVWAAAGRAFVVRVLAEEYERQQQASVRGMKPLNAAPVEMSFLDW